MISVVSHWRIQGSPEIEIRKIRTTIDFRFLPERGAIIIIVVMQGNHSHRVQIEVVQVPLHTNLLAAYALSAFRTCLHSKRKGNLI